MRLLRYTPPGETFADPWWLPGVVDLTDADLDFVPWLDAGAAKVHPLDRSRHRSHMVRWRFLYEQGGAWIDHDVLLMGLLSGDTFAASHGEICTCVVSLPAGHPAALAMLDRIEAAPAADVCSADVSGWRAFARVVTPDVILVPMLLEACHPVSDRACA